MINDQITAIKSERDAGKIDVTTRVLLDKPYTSANGVTTSATTNSPDVLTTSSENASLIGLGIGSSGPGVTHLQTVLTDLGYDAGTIAALNQFQQDQLELIQNKIPDVSRTTQPEIYNLLLNLGSDLVVEQSQNKSGELTANLLENPITSEMLNDAISKGDNGTGGLITVGSFSNWLWGRADPSIKELAGMLGEKSPEEITETIDNVDLDDINKWAKNIRDIDASSRIKIYELLTDNLDGERLLHFFDSLSFGDKDDLIKVLNSLKDGRLIEKLNEARGINNAVIDVPQPLVIKLPSEEDVVRALAELRTYPEFKNLEANSPNGKLTLEFTSAETRYKDGIIYINLDFFNYAYKTEAMPDDYMNGFDEFNSPDEWQERYDSYPEYAQYSVHRVLFHEAFHGTQPPPSFSHAVNSNPEEKPAIEAANAFMAKHFNEIGRVDRHDLNIYLPGERIDSKVILLQ